MSSFKIFDIAGSGMSAQSVRLNTVASNLANADSVTATIPTSVLSRPSIRCFRPCSADSAQATMPRGASVTVTGIANPATPASRAMPSNPPLADAQGFVYAPNVNVVEEMADMISASRSYQNDVEVLNTSRDLMLDTLKLRTERQLSGAIRQTGTK